MADVDIQLGYKNAAWFATNAAHVLEVGQIVYLEQTGTYKLGDGTSVLSALSFLGASGSGVQTVTGDGVDNTDPLNPVLSFPTPNEIGAEPLKGADDNYVTDAQLTVIQNTSGTNTGDQDLSGLQATSAKDATGGYVGLTLFKINFKNVLNTFTSFFTNSNTAARTYTFPDKDGTVAMTSDITVKRVIRDTTTTGAVTGTAANTLCASYLVSGGVNVVGDILQIAFRTIKTNANGTYTIRLYVNTSSSLSGATLLGTYTTGTVAGLTNEFGRYLAIKSSTVTEVSPSAVASVYPLNAYNAVVTNANIDHTSPQYYIVAIQPSGSNADVISNSWFSMISL